MAVPVGVKLSTIARGGSSVAADRILLQGPHSRLRELLLLMRAAADFLRGFRVLHFVGPCVTVFGSARFGVDHPFYELGRTVGHRLADIGFTVMGVLDTSALSTFADTGSAYVTTWYDQSGGARHLTQTTTAAQPRIVSSGVVDTSGGLPSIVFDGTDDHLKSSTVGLFAAGATTMTAVMTGASATAAVFMSEHQAGGNGYYRLLRSSSANWMRTARADHTASANSTTPVFGNSRVMRVPWPGALSMAMRAPCGSSSARVSGNPKPVPS